MSYKQFPFTQASIDRTIQDLRSGASDDFVRSYFADDPEMLAHLDQHNQMNAQTDDEEVATVAQA